MDKIDEEAIDIEGFPAYDITNWGRVLNLRTKRSMVLSPTMNGDLTVGLTREGHQYRYSVKGLVAKAFCNFEYLSDRGVVGRAFISNETELFNTPVLLDGDKYNLYFENIVWRPRWFAWRYTNQFTDLIPWYQFGPIQEVGTNNVYDSYMDAAIDNGVLCVDIRESIYNSRLIFPTWQKFEYVGKYTNR
jgi:hypothetical protein